MTHLIVQGAHAHNLRHVDLTVQWGTLVVFRGPSGSGKSSLALDVIHAESRRRLLEVLRSPGSGGDGLPAVAVDRIEGLPPTVAVAPDDAARPDLPLANFSDIGSTLRSLFASRGVLHCPESGIPLRAWTVPEVLADLSDLSEGARLTIGAPLPVPTNPARVLAELRRSGFARIRLGTRIVRLDAIDKLPKGVSIELIVDRVKWRPDRHDRVGEALNTAWKAGQGDVTIEIHGDAPNRRYGRSRRSPSGTVWPPTRPEHFNPQHPLGACSECSGQGCLVCGHSGLGAIGRHTHFEGHLWPALIAAPLSTTHARLSELPGIPPLLLRQLHALIAVGLGDRPLGQPLRTFGRGEWRRAVLARALHLAESPRILVVDEPLSGLSPAQAVAVCSVLRETADSGATVVVIEHRPEVLDVADQVITFGPGGGPSGGSIMTPEPSTAPAAWAPPTPKRTDTAPLWRVVHPRVPIPMAFPEGRWTVVTGASGSGTSTIVHHTLAAHFAGRRLDEGARVEGPEPRLLEASLPKGATAPRSCVATLAKIWGPIRELLTRTKEARVRGLGTDAFTFNRATGWCPACEGLGQRMVRFGPLPPMSETCAVCGGGRLRPDVEPVVWRGHSARQLLTIDVLTAQTLFATHPRLAPILDALTAVGLSHLPLGRPSESLSSGERRRFSVALTIARLRSADRDPRPTLVVLDQPDAGLDDHTAQVVSTWLADATRGRATLVTVAHHPALLEAADAVWVL